jgi:drug/metabolite transporter (DMT)-like permease
MAGVRFLLAGGILYGFARARGLARPTPRQWGGAAVVGGLLLLGGNGGVVWAEQFVASGLVALLVAVEPLWVALLDWARPGGCRPTRATAAGMLLGVAGVAILVGPKEVAAGGIPWLPALVVLFASGSWALGSLYSLRAPLPPSPVVATGAEMLTGGALMLLVGLARGEAAAFDPAAVSLRSLLGFGYLVVFGSLVAFSAYVYLLRTASPSKASTYAFVNPVVAVVLGWLLASEPLTPRVGIASALVVAAVVLVTTGKRRPGPEALPKAAAGETPEAGEAAGEERPAAAAAGPAVVRAAERAA